MINQLLRNKVFLAMVLVFVSVMAAFVFMLGDGRNSDDMQVDQNAAAGTPTEEISAAPAAEEETGYYFVKVVDDAVNVYWYEGDKKELYRETDIEFSLLSAEDQQLLQTGIRLEDEQELASFLENFDS